MLTLKPLRERRRNRLKEIDGLFGNNYSLFKVKSKDPGGVDFDPLSPTFRKPAAPQKDLYFADGTKVPTIKDVPKLPTAREVQARFNKMPSRPKSMFRMYCSAPAFKRVQKSSQPTPLMVKNRLQNLHGETSKYFTPQYLQQGQPSNELIKKFQSRTTNAQSSRSVKLKPTQSPWVTRARSQRVFDQSEDVGSWTVHKLLDKHAPYPEGFEDFRGGQNASYDDDDKDTSYGDFGNVELEQHQTFDWTMSDDSTGEDTRSGSSKFVQRPQPFLREEPERVFGSFDRSNGSNNGNWDENNGSLDRNNATSDRNNTSLDLQNFPEYFDGIGTMQNGNISSTILESNTPNCHHENKRSYPKFSRREQNSASSQYSQTGCLCSSCKSNSSATTPPPFTIRELIHMNKQNEQSSSNASDHSSNFNPLKSKTSGFRSSQVNNNWADNGNNAWTNTDGNQCANNGGDTSIKIDGNIWVNNCNNNNNDITLKYEPAGNPVRNLFKRSSTITSSEEGCVLNFPTFANSGFDSYPEPPHYRNDLKVQLSAPETPELFSSNNNDNNLPPPQDQYSYNYNNNSTPPQCTPPELIIHDPYGRVSSWDTHERTKTSSGLGDSISRTSTMSSTHWPADDPMRAFGTQHFNHLECNPFKEFEDDAASKRTVDTDLSFSPSGSQNNQSYDFQDNTNGGGWEFDNTDDDLFENL